MLDTVAHLMRIFCAGHGLESLERRAGHAVLLRQPIAAVPAAEPLIEIPVVPPLPRTTGAFFASGCRKPAYLYIDAEEDGGSGNHD